MHLITTALISLAVVIDVGQGKNHKIKSWEEFCTKLSVDCNGPRTIPSNVSSLVELEELSLDSQELTGSIPVEIGELTNLKKLSLEKNKLVGAIPSELSNLINLASLSLADNLLSKIPEGLSFDGTFPLLSLHMNNFACDRGSLPGLGEIPWTRVTVPDQVLCGEWNEFEKIPLRRIQFSDGEPESSPVLHVQNVSAFSARVKVEDPNTGLDTMGNHGKTMSANSTCTCCFAPTAAPVPFPADMRRLDECEEATSPSCVDTLSGILDQETFPCQLLSRVSVKLVCTPPELSIFSLEWRSRENTRDVKRICTTRQHVWIEELSPFTDMEVRAKTVKLFWASDEVRVGIPNQEFTYRLLELTGPATQWQRFQTLTAKPDGPPQFVQVDNSSLTETSVAFSWQPPRSLNGELDFYLVHVYVNGEFRNVQKSDKAFYLNQALVAGDNCTIQVAAVLVDGKQSDLSQSVTAYTASSCPSGTERQVLPSYSCVKCKKGQFRTLGRSQTCEDCPATLPRTLSEGSTSSADCIVGEGSLEVDNGEKERRVKLCTDTDLKGKVLCDAVGTTMTSVSLVPGFWRPSNRTLTILPCPRSDFCTPPKKRSLLPGLSTRDTYCATFHTGVYCQDCIADYGMESEGCVPCSEDTRKTNRASFIGWLVFFVLIISFPSGWLVYKARCTKPPREQVRQEEEKPSASGCFSYVNSAKFMKSRRVKSIRLVLRSLVGFFQVYLPFAAAAGLFENSDRSFAEVLFNFDFSAVLRSLRIDCFWKTNYYSYLLIYTLFPLLVIVLLALTLGGLTRCFSSPNTPKLFGFSFWLVLVLLFFVYPGLSSAILKVFLHKDYILDDVDESQVLRVLRADNTVPYYSESSDAWRIYAIVFVFIYPVGVLVLFTCCSYYYTVQTSKDTEMLTATQQAVTQNLSFLCESYRFPFFESLELLRKLMLTSGFLIVFQASEIGGIAFFVILNTLNMLLLALTRPFVDLHADLNLAVAILNSIALFLLGVLSMLQVTASLAPVTGRSLAILLAAFQVLVCFVVMYQMAHRHVPASDDEDQNKTHPQRAPEEQDEREGKEIKHQQTQEHITNV